MAEIPVSELAHIDIANLHGRTLLLMPVWDGANWRAWAATTPGNMIEIKIVDTARSNYLAKAAARPDDVHIQLIDFMWQQASWPEVAREVFGLADDLHLLATSAAKIEHFYQFRSSIDDTLLGSFVRSEVEHMLVLVRSIFDLFQAATARFWNERFQLIDAAADAQRKHIPLPRTFSDLAFGKGKARTAEELTARYALPATVAAAYAKHIAFFEALRASRDRVVHFGATIDHVFVTERGFAVDPRSRDWRDYPWEQPHHFNDNIVSLMPWLARAVFGTLEACSEILAAYRGVLQFPPAIAPGYRVFIRDPSNAALLRLHEAALAKRIWWDQPLEDQAVA